jgi:hypothetical protein
MMNFCGIFSRRDRPPMQQSCATQREFQLARAERCPRRSVGLRGVNVNRREEVTACRRN